MAAFLQPICLEVGSGHGDLAPYERKDGIKFDIENVEQMSKLWTNLVEHSKSENVNVRLWVPDFDMNKNVYSSAELDEVYTKFIEPGTHQLKLIHQTGTGKHGQPIRGPKLVVTKIGNDNGSMNKRMNWI